MKKVIAAWSVDVLLFLLLLFAERWARENFPSQVDMEKFDFSGLTLAGTWFMFIGSLLAIFCFFTRPANAETDPKKISWLGITAKIINVFGLFGVSFTAAIMFSMGIFRLGDFYFSDEQRNGTAAIILGLIAILSMFILPFFLYAKYIDKPETLKPMHPALRGVFLMPLMFLSAAFLNSAEQSYSGKFGLSSAADFAGFFFSNGLNFLMFYFAPRMFAYGEPAQNKEAPAWILRFGLFFCGSYFGT